MNPFNFPVHCGNVTAPLPLNSGRHPPRVRIDRLAWQSAEESVAESVANSPSRPTPALLSRAPESSGGTSPWFRVRFGQKMQHWWLQNRSQSILHSHAPGRSSDSWISEASSLSFYKLLPFQALINQFSLSRSDVTSSSSEAALGRNNIM
jgi:hypothetical protein